MNRNTYRIKRVIRMPLKESRKEEEEEVNEPTKKTKKKEEVEIKEGSIASKKSLLKDGKLLTEDPEMKKLMKLIK